MRKTSKRMLCLLLTLVMALTLAGPVSAAGEITVEQAIHTLLDGSGLSKAQIGSDDADYISLAKSLGMIGDGENVKAVCSAEKLAEMTAVRDKLYAALHSSKMEPLFLNGMAQPIFPFTSGATASNYSNDNSDVIRYFVYVETNYDTDNDGSYDLIKVLVQVPRAAAEGDYKAATIYEARPYIAGCIENFGAPYAEDPYEPYVIDDNAGAARSTSGLSTATTLEAAKNARSSEWYYWNEQEEMHDYEDLDWYNYYLVRGYAVVEAAGLGTLGSEGFETCGDKYEIDAFKCVIEWLNGDANRHAFTDAEGTQLIKADWSNGKVGMTGRSYAGTTQFALAATGVKGLETIVPVAGIASWYEYTNSQGMYNGGLPNYTDDLAWYCASRYLDVTGAEILDDGSLDLYSRYLSTQRQAQVDGNGDYSDHWATRDYTLTPEKITAPALIVHGLNDDNVRTKQFDLMYQAYEKAGVDAKIILHQDGHLTPTYPSWGFSFEVNGQSYDSILNKWFSHYLYGVNNDVADMPAVLAQDNHNGKIWHTYDSWDTEAVQQLKVATTGKSTISSDYSLINYDVNSHRWDYSLSWSADMIGGNTPVSARYTTAVDKDTIIKGSVAVSFSASVTNGDAAAATASISAPRGDHDLVRDVPRNDEGIMTLAETGTPLNQRDGLMVSAMLVDIAPAGETFNAFNTEGSYVPKNYLGEGIFWQGGGLAKLDQVELVSKPVSSKIIARGWMDLCNPSAGYDSNTAGSSSKITLQEGVPHNYTIYLQPNLYQVEAGHTLAVIIYTYEPSAASYTQNYKVTIDNASVKADVPVDDSHDCPTGQFVDVDQNLWYHVALDYAVDNGLMNGTSTTKFQPNATTTRAQLVTILHRLEGEPEAAEASSFTDVTDGDWYADAVAWAAENNIVNGTSETTFSPNASITREQMAAILYRYADFKGYDVSAAADLSGYADAGKVSSYAVDAMSWVNAEGIITGVNATTLDPKGNATRAQVATILMRYCEDVAK